MHCQARDKLVHVYFLSVPPLYSILIWYQKYANKAKIYIIR
jgi:hypothetical protein